MALSETIDELEGNVPAVDTEGQALDLRLLLAALRRRRLFIVLGALVGAAGGLLVAYLVPAPYTSTSVVLVGSPPNSGGLALDISTYQRLMLSTDVLRVAADQLDADVTVDELRASVDIGSPAPSLVEIRASDALPDGAEAKSAAIAAAFVGYVTDLSSSRSTDATASVEGEIRRLQDQADEIDAALAAAEERQAGDSRAQVDDEAQLVATLTAERSDLALRISTLQEQLRGGPASDGVRLGVTVEILDSGEPVRPSEIRRSALAALLGALLGMLLPIAWAVRREVGDRSIRSPSTLVRVLGAPVLMTLQARPQRTPDAWRSFLASFTPSPQDVWAVRVLLRTLAQQAGRSELVRHRQPHAEKRVLSVVVIAFASDLRGQSLAPVMAVAASSLRLSTTLSAIGDGGTASSLWAGLTLARRKGLARDMLQVTRWPDQDPDCAVTVGLTVADLRQADFAELPAADAYVLALGAGVATADDISRVALAADAADVTLSAVILANPGEWDEDAGPQPWAGLDGHADVADGQSARSSSSNGGNVSGKAS